MSIDRRKFLKGAAATAAASTVFSAHSFAQTGNVRWKCATSWPRSLADRVSAMTDGKFTIRPYEAGELVPGLQVLDAVQQGTVECGHSAGDCYVGKNPTLGLATGIPFGLTASEQNAWTYSAGGLELVRAV